MYTLKPEKIEIQKTRGRKQMTEVIPLHETYRGLHPETGKPVTVVGVDTSGIVPALIIIRSDEEGIRAEIVQSVNALPMG